jgi:hypothetical protein
MLVENSPADKTILEHVTKLAKCTGAALVLIHVADGWAARHFDQLKLRESEEMRSDRAYLEGLKDSLIAQGFGWNWGENLEPHEDARFSLTFTVIIAAATVFVVVGLDPLKMTEISMALTAASLPVGVFPFLILMNDKKYLGKYTNGYISNGVVLAISIIAGILGIVSIPLQIMGS